MTTSSPFVRLSAWLLLIVAVTACVDPFPVGINSALNVIVVDGTLTNLPEPQFISLTRSLADPISGRFGVALIKNAKVEVIMDSTQVIPLHETRDGLYQLPGDFKGQPGHSYQLRFVLEDGTHYESNSEVMPDAVPISRIYHKFNPGSLPAKRYDGQLNRVQAAHDIFVDWQDPASTKNYYRWEWTLWEKQIWCSSCSKGYYLIWDQVNQDQRYESCFSYAPVAGSTSGESGADFVNDYLCRTKCWEVLYSYDLNLFDDAFSNGGKLTGRRVAQIPYYQEHGALVEVRQSSLTEPAHRYFRLLQEQSQNTGGVADTPPTVLAGNVRNTANAKEVVVGFFSVTGVAASRYWLDRLDATGGTPGLFYGLTGLKPSPEDLLVDPNNDRGKPLPGFGGKNSVRPPTALCVPSGSRTPFVPAGWRD